MVRYCLPGPTREGPKRAGAPPGGPTLPPGGPTLPPGGPTLDGGPVPAGAETGLPHPPGGAGGAIPGPPPLGPPACRVGDRDPTLLLKSSTAFGKAGMSTRRQLMVVAQPLR